MSNKRLCYYLTKTELNYLCSNSTLSRGVFEVWISPVMCGHHETQACVKYVLQGTSCDYSKPLHVTFPFFRFNYNSSWSQLEAKPREHLCARISKFPNFQISKFPNFQI